MSTNGGHWPEKQKSRKRNWMLLAALCCLPISVYAQAPTPALEHGETAGMLLKSASRLGAPVPVAQVAQMELLLANQARVDAMSIATTYARPSARRLPGVEELGRELLEELRKRRPDFDFQGMVSHNPAFWAAERELAPRDVSLPYLVAMLAILSHDQVTAARIIALTQATLPLPPSVRRGYARPEAMMLYEDGLLLTGIPSGSRMETVAQCERGITLLRERIAQWSNRPGLLRALIELEVRRVELLTRDGENLALRNQRIREQLSLTPADLAFARQHDPILASGFDATVRDWLDKTTLAQQWSRWIELGYPAEPEEVESSVAAFAANDRPDLAWLAWRTGRAMRSFASTEEQRRWIVWCEALLDKNSAAYLEKTTAADPFAGQAAVPIENEGFSEAWSGDQRIHPLLAIKIERRIAIVDTVLSVVAPNSGDEGNYRLKRAELLAEIDAIEPARRELRRVRQIIGDSETIMAMPGVKVMEFIKVVEARLLDSEGHYAESEQMYQELLRNTRLSGLTLNYQAHLFVAGNLPAAHRQFQEYAIKNSADTYRSIMADLTARRLGQRETEILEVARRNIRAESWPADGVNYLLGKMTEEELLTSARQGTSFEIIDRESEAYFWLGEVALAEGRTEDGIKWLNRCVGTGFLSNVEYKIAVAELQRLDEKAERKKRGPENSNGAITT